MFTFAAIPDHDKDLFYQELTLEITGLLEDSWLANLANTSAALMAHMRHLNWVGFYVAQETSAGSVLHLGPFQGLPACLAIPFGKGVCGKAALERRTERVSDVHAFPGHIACDARSRSEIVVPLLGRGRVLGVLDLDSPLLSRFDEVDQMWLEKIARALVERTVWPENFL